MTEKICEPTVSWVEHLFESIIKTYEKLKELGFIYYKGSVVVVEDLRKFTNL